MHFAQSTFGIRERAAQEHHNLIFGQRLQYVDSAAGEQRSVDFERRIFGGSADQANAAFFDMGEKGILLRLVEAMNFIDENDGSGAVLASAVGVAHDLLDLLDPDHHGGKSDEIGLGDAGDDLSESGLARARWSPEDHRGRIVALDLHAQRLAGTDEMFLADEFIERPWTHAVG